MDRREDERADLIVSIWHEKRRTYVAIREAIADRLTENARRVSLGLKALRLPAKLLNDLEAGGFPGSVVHSRAVAVAEKAAGMVESTEVTGKIAAMELAWLNHLAEGGQASPEAARELFALDLENFEVWYDLWTAAR